MFEALDQEPGETEEKNWSKKTFEGSAQLQAGGNEIDPATAFEEVTGINFFVYGLFFLDVGVGNCVVV